MTDLLSSGNVKHIYCSPLFMALHNLPYVVIPSICVELGSKEVWSWGRNQHLAGGAAVAHLDEASVKCFSATGTISKTCGFRTHAFWNVDQAKEVNDGLCRFWGVHAPNWRDRLQLENLAKSKFYMKLDR